MLLCELWLWLCTFAGRMTTIVEVHDKIRKVQGELEELRKLLQEEVHEAERAHLWKEEELLMKEEEQLRQKEFLLMQSGQNNTALVQHAGHNNNSLVQQPAQNTPISSTFSFPCSLSFPVLFPCCLSLFLCLVFVVRSVASMAESSRCFRNCSTDPVSKAAQKALYFLAEVASSTSQVCVYSCSVEDALCFMDMLLGVWEF